MTTTRRAGPLLLPILLLWPTVRAHAGKAAIELSEEHHHPTGGFVFRTPAGWNVKPVPGRTGAIEASSGTLHVRLIHTAGELGFDVAHALCTAERLTSGADFDPRIRYEYEYLSGEVADRRFLDSAYFIRYEPALQGQAEWRQRALTVVGAGETLCLLSAAPRGAWKRGENRKLLDAIVTSVSFDEPADPVAP